MYGLSSAVLQTVWPRENTLASRQESFGSLSIAVVFDFDSGHSSTATSWTTVEDAVEAMVSSALGLNGRKVTYRSGSPSCRIFVASVFSRSRREMLRLSLGERESGVGRDTLSE